MAKLSNLQLASLLDEIAAAMRVGTPIVDALQRLSERRLGQVAKTAGRFADSMQRGQSVAETIGQSGSGMTQQAAGAVAASERTGNPEVLDRFAALLRSRHDYMRSMRLSWIYPVVLLGIAYAIAVAVMAPLLRKHHGRDFAWSDSLLVVSHWLESNWYIPPIVMVGVLGVIWILYRGKNSLPHNVRLHLLCQSLVDQIEGDVPETEAISNAAILSGDESLLLESNPTFKSPAMQALLSSAPSLLKIPGVSEEETLISQLKYLAAVYAERARRHEYVWVHLVPRVAMVVVGGTIALSYVWWVIAPVYQQVARW